MTCTSMRHAGMLGMVMLAASPPRGLMSTEPGAVVRSTCSAAAAAWQGKGMLVRALFPHNSYQHAGAQADGQAIRSGRLSVLAAGACRSCFLFTHSQGLVVVQSRQHQAVGQLRRVVGLGHDMGQQHLRQGRGGATSALEPLLPAAAWWLLLSLKPTGICSAGTGKGQTGMVIPW